MRLKFEEIAKRADWETVGFGLLTLVILYLFIVILAAVFFKAILLVALAILWFIWGNRRIFNHNV